MSEQTEQPEQIPDLGTALVQALEQMRLHSLELTGLSNELSQFVANLHARVSGAEAVAAVVDENETNVQIDRQVAAGKEIISHLYEKSQQYVTIVVGGAYAAYFTTLSTVSSRFSDNELRLSALLMTISLTLFVVWEVINVAYVGWYSLRGQLRTDVPGWYKKTWPIVIAASLLTALPAVGFSLYAYTSGLITPHVKESTALAKPKNQTSSTSRP
jgi:hypothetical protein